MYIVHRPRIRITSNNLSSNITLSTESSCCWSVLLLLGLLRSHRAATHRKLGAWCSHPLLVGNIVCLAGGCQPANYKGFKDLCQPAVATHASEEGHKDNHPLTLLFPSRSSQCNEGEIKLAHFVGSNYKSKHPHNPPDLQPKGVGTGPVSFFSNGCKNLEAPIQFSGVLVLKCIRLSNKVVMST